ncbi:hypothetical protein BG004_005674 [Podila humilis]|nr:hypothetical protein BG004_005674 [Podila humilis]
MAAAIASSRLDGLSEVTELESIPLPYKTLYHTLVFKNEMPVDLLKERHQTGSEQLLTWIEAALRVVDTVVESQLTQQSQVRPDDQFDLLDRDEEEGQEELEIEIQDVVSGFGHYEPTIESSIEILLQLEESIASRTIPSSANPSAQASQPLSSLSITSSSLSLSSTSSLTGYSPPSTLHLSPEIEKVLKQWSRLRGIVGGLGGSVREHQRIRDGIQSVNNIAEQTHRAAQLLEKCLMAIAEEKQVCRRAFEEGLLPSRSAEATPKVGVDGNDMLELDSMVGLLSLQIESLQKSFPECTSDAKNSDTLERFHPYKRSQSHQHTQQEEHIEHQGLLAHKKQIVAGTYQELLVDWSSLKRRKEQLWRDLEECDRWRARIEKMARQIESMLDPVEIFHKICSNLLTTLHDKSPLQPIPTSQNHVSTNEPLESQDPQPLSPSQSQTPVMDEPTPADMEMLASTLQELEEKQNMVAPAIENMFWVQEGEIQHRTKHIVHSPSTPSTAVPPSAPQSPLGAFVGSPLDFSSPLYPNMEMVERQRHLKSRWSSLRSSLDTVGTQLQQHHKSMVERANAAAARRKEEAEKAARAQAEAAAAAAAEAEARRGRSLNGSGSSSMIRRSSIASSHQSSSVTSQAWNSSTRVLRTCKLVPSLSMDSPTVRKYMLLKSDKPVTDKPRPWCPSINPLSPGMPGFPVQTSTWGYFILTTSKSMDSFGSVIAAPAPLPVASPRAPKSPPPKINRPPFSPGGYRGFSSIAKPTPPPTRITLPQRSVSVAGGDYRRNRCMSPTISWEKKMVRRSNSMAFDDNGSFGNNNKQSSSKADPNSSNSRRNSTQHSNDPGQRRASFSFAKSINNNNNNNNASGSEARDNSRRGSIVTHKDGTWYNRHHPHRGSMDHGSSSEDETVTGEFHSNNKVTRGYKNFSRQGLRTRTGQNDSSSSLDSMMSSENSCGGGEGGGRGGRGGRGRGYSSLSSQGELRSPSPPLPLPYPSAFGSSFAAARSTAALHTALLSSMSSHSSSGGSSFRNPSALSMSSQRTDSRQSEHESLTSSRHSSGISLLTRRHRMQHLQPYGQSHDQQQNQQQQQDSKPSSWVGSGSLISALSFRVPTYSFEDDFGSFESTACEGAIVN